MNSAKRCRADHQVRCQCGIQTVRCQDGGHFFSLFFLRVALGEHKDVEVLKRDVPLTELSGY